MKIDITGNPGTGNTFQEFNIQHVDNLNPKATTVINNYSDGRKLHVRHETNTEGLSDIDTTPIRADIWNYVSRLKNYLADEWKSRYESLWNRIIDIPEVSAQIYKPGKQQGTNFNRNLVAHIIYYIGNNGLIPNYNAAQLAVALEGDKDHSIRHALGVAPDKPIVDKIKAVL